MIRTRSTLFCGLLTLGLLFAGMSAPASAATARPAASAGSAAVGSAKYTVPTGAIFVATSGKDTAAGTKSAPVKTVTQALKLVPTGGTIVLRAGSYNETVEIYKKVTIQNYPGEAVWLDGSIPVTGWVKDGSTWRKDGWKVRFDHSPTYTKGAKDRTDDWQMVNPAVPMAPYPDQVWTGTTRLTQVASKKAVTSGKFYLDESTSKLYVGSDPTGGARASNLQYAINVRATGVTIRGIGIRRFATSVWQMGSVTLESPNATVENVLIAESATTGISVINSGATLTKLTVENNGMLGIHGNNADRITLTSVVARNNNTENFNTGPVASGMKITKSRGVKVTNSSFANNNGHGFWEDQSVYDSVLSGNNFTGNKGYGLFLEISAKAIVADSLILNNKREGLVVNNFSNAQIWNNTIVGNSRPIWLAQDDRTPTKNDAGVDKRVAWPDPEMTWKVDQVTLSNNVLGIQAAGNTMLCVEDYTYTRTAEQMHVTTNGNVYNRATATSPSWLSIWSRGSAGAYTFTTLNAMKSTTKQEARGREYTGASVVDSKGALSASVVSQASAIALPLPSAVAAAIGRPAGTAALGAWVDAAASTPTPTPTTPTPTPTPTPTTPTPKPSVTSATDTFNRTVAHGWGTAKRGGTWSVPKAASKRFAVAHGVGSVRLKAGQSSKAILSSVSSSSTDSRVYFALDRKLTGKGRQYVSLIGRDKGSARYELKTRVEKKGKVTIWLVRKADGKSTILAKATPSVTLPNKGTLAIRLQVTGTSPTKLRAKVWNAKRQQPTKWTVRATDKKAKLQSAGAVGLWVYTGPSVSNGPVTVFFDDLYVTRP